MDSILAADPLKPTVDPVPYVGISFAVIPEWQGIGTDVGQQFSGALAGTVTPEDALKNAQKIATDAMTKAGYIK